MDNKNIKRKKFPQDHVGYISKWFFMWLVPLFYKACKKNLEEDDLFEPRKSHEASFRESHLTSLWKIELSYLSTGKSPSFLRALWKAFGMELVMLTVFYRTIELCFLLIQTWCLQELLLYLKPGSTGSQQDAILYTIGIILSTFLNTITSHNFRLWSSDISVKVYVACNTVIFQKIFQLDTSAFMSTSMGQIVNLLANDVRRIFNSIFYTNSFFGVILYGVVFSYMIFQFVGIPSFVGMGFLIFLIPVQVFIGMKASSIRSKTTLLTDERIQLMNEIISGIETIKMYAWEKPFASIVAATRRKEMRQIVKSNYIQGFILASASFVCRISVYLIIITYLYFGNHLTAEKIFITTLYYNVMKENFTIFLPLGMFQVGEAIVSIQRIQKFLLSHEVDQVYVKMSPNDENDKENAELDTLLQQTQNSNDVFIHNNKVNNNLKCDENVAIQMESLSFKYSTQRENILENISCKIERQNLVAIIGPVGCGKSTLLNMILRENRPVEGSIVVNGSISYAQQDPWLFNNTIKQNILFGLPFDQKKYDEVIDCCSLRLDLQLFPNGDKMKVGEHGVKLSGGQKARISLARAIYRDADIYLLDDPLSAVDAHVGKLIFDKCIKNYLRNKTCILVTHQLQYMNDVEQIIILNQGKILANGNFATLQAMQIDLADMLKNQNDDDDENNGVLLEQNNQNNNCKSLIGSRASCLNENKLNDEDDDDDEHRNIGSVNHKAYVKYLRYGGNQFTIAFLIFLLIFHRILTTFSDYFISVWINVEERLSYSHPNITFSKSFNDWGLDSQQCLITYSVLLLVIIFMVIYSGILCFNICMKSSTVSHEKMFSNIVTAKMNFYHSNPSGRILNRFSKDIGIIDETIPPTLFEVVQNVLLVISVCIALILINIWMLIPSIVITIIFILFYKVYALTSLSLKRLEATTQSPVFNTVSATLRGLITVRVLRAESILTEEFYNNLNLHANALYLVHAVSRALGFWLEIITILYTGVVIFSLLLMEGTADVTMGLVVTQCMMMLGTLQWAIREYAELETQMVSFERVLEYMNIPSEIPDNLNIVHTTEREPWNVNKITWPKHGEIEFKNVYLKYSLSESPVLKGLNFRIFQKEKIGIVGRTGAGKSSLVAALFRLIEPEGQIMIDGIDTKTVDIQFLRAKISIIPQIPVLFSATMRCNLDPFDQYSDEEIWQVLEDVQLKRVISSLPSSLNTLMRDGGSSLSIGQRQLVCMARAILKKNKILVLDEATANIDLQTDSLIQKTIRDKFATCTVLTIAHRLHTVMDSDRILILHKGAVAEFDHPFKLLQESNSAFSQMVNKTGTVMALNLKKIAQKSYEEKIRKKD